MSVGGGLCRPCWSRKASDEMSVPGWQRMAGVVGAAFVGIVGLFVVSCLRDNPRHCANSGGDAQCVSLHGTQSYCSRCTAHEDGCVDERPSESCHAPSESGANEESGESTMSTTSESETGTETSVEVGCSEPGLDPVCPDDAPYCVEGSCVSCGSGGGSALCQQIDAAKPLCHQAAGLCVACLPGQVESCTHTEPFCDETFSCSGCTEHSQCPDSACDIERGTCFAESRVFWVDNSGANCPDGGTGSQADPYCTINDALDEVKQPGRAAFELESEGVIKIIRTATPYTERILLTVGQDKRIALIGVGSPAPLIRDQEYAIAVGRQRLFVSNLSLSHNTDDGLRSGTYGRIWVDDSTMTGNATGVHVSFGARVRMRRSRIVGNHGYGIITRREGARIHVASSVIGNNGDDTDGGGGVRVEEESSVDIVYTTMVNNQSTGVSSIDCLVGGSVAVRNSIVIAPGLNSISCGDSTYSHSFVDSSIDGEGVVVTTEYDEEWFVNVGNGIFRPVSNNPFRDVAVWQLGDPLYDLAGMVRSWVPGSPDVAGALLP
jgi:hypothetical protein